jgi:UDP-N-acetylglucosamine transferase subunit ALG13
LENSFDGYLLMDIFVTVGMGRWPFDRLLKAVVPLCRSHTVVVQRGPSKVEVPSRTYDFLPFQEFLNYIERAQVVITHAGNTVRLVQRKGKVPIAMAREARWGEMADDHQVEYLRYEEEHGRVVGLWEVTDLPRLVENHPAAEALTLKTRSLPEKMSGEVLAATLNSLCAKWVK